MFLGPSSEYSGHLGNPGTRQVFVSTTQAGNLDSGGARTFSFVWVACRNVRYELVHDSSG